jgi:hypothetical protein
VPHPENLRPPWKPGESGNPTGSSKKQRFRAAFERMLDKGGDTHCDEFMEVARKAALAGDFNFWRYLYEIIEGKLPESEHEPEVDLRTIAERMAERRKERERERQVKERDKPS